MAWTAPRTWVDGELVTAAIMNPHIRDNFNAMPDHILARKSADESIASSTSLQNDDHLFFAMGTSETWFLRLVLWGVEGGGFLQQSITMPASGTAKMCAVYFNTSGTLTTIQYTESTATSTQMTPAAGQVQEYLGFAQTAGTAGNWQFRWAQGVSNGVATTLKKGSFLTGWQIT